MNNLKEHDTVRLIEGVINGEDVYPAGTLGAVISTYDEGKLVLIEIVEMTDAPIIFVSALQVELVVAS